MKRSTKIFFRSFYISATAVCCFAIAIFGTAKAYENTRNTAFGEYKKALEITGDYIRILDFEIPI